MKWNEDLNELYEFLCEEDFNPDEVQVCLMEAYDDGLNAGKAELDTATVTAWEKGFLAGHNSDDFSQGVFVGGGLALAGVGAVYAIYKFVKWRKSKKEGK